MENKQVLLTAQDIEDVQFKKSFGRYETDGVDAFLDRCAETVEALTRTNAENEHKMQVLGQSIVEYRAQEDTIRNALMNAQRMSDTILGEARQQAEQITAEAKEGATLHIRYAEVLGEDGRPNYETSAWHDKNEKGRMDIDDAVRECVHKIFSADTHVSCQADEIGRIGLGSNQNGCIEVRFRAESFPFENGRRYIPALGAFKDLGIGMVTNHADHSAVNGTVYRRFMDGFSIRSPAGSENQNFLTHGKDHLSQ